MPKKESRYDNIGLEYNPDYIRTPSLYLPTGKWAHEMTYDELLRGLCHKARIGKGVDECRACSAPCTFGKLLVRMKEDHE